LQKKAKNKKKQKKEKNKDAEPKTAIEVPEGMLKQKEVKDNDNRVPVNKLVQLPPATQYPLLAKDKSTIGDFQLQVSTVLLHNPFFQSALWTVQAR